MINPSNSGSLVDAFFSAIDGDLPAVGAMVQAHPGLVAAVGSNGETPLHRAALWGHSDIVQYLLAQGADVNARDSAGRIPLFEASTKAVAEMLVAHGADPLILRPDGGTVLLEAVSGGMPVELVAHLLSLGCNPNARTKDGTEAICLAATFGHAALVDLLLSHGVNPDSRCCLWGTPLMGAIINGHCDTVDVLLRHEATLQDRDGDTPLHVAAAHNAVEMVRHLLARGAQVNAVNRKGQTPLHQLAGQVNPVDLEKQREMVDLLLAKGADPSIADHEGRTPVHEAIEFGDQFLWSHLLNHGGETDPFIVAAIGIPEWLYERGEADPMFAHMRDARGYTLVHWAAMRGHTRALSLLLQIQADVNARDHEGQTPLHIAVAHKEMSGAEWLLSHGAEVDAIDNDGSTPLMVAAYERAYDLMVLLMRHGADVGRKGHAGRTALHAVAEFGWVEVVAMLLSLGAPVNGMTLEGETALDLALNADGDTELAKLLRMHGGRRGDELRRPAGA